jgi:hypothetical protein
MIYAAAKPLRVGLFAISILTIVSSRAQIAGTGAISGTAEDPSVLLCRIQESLR